MSRCRERGPGEQLCSYCSSSWTRRVYRGLLDIVGEAQPGSLFCPELLLHVHLWNCIGEIWLDGERGTSCRILDAAQCHHASICHFAVVVEVSADFATSVQQQSTMAVSRELVQVPFFFAGNHLWYCTPRKETDGCMAFLLRGSFGVSNCLGHGDGLATV